MSEWLLRNCTGAPAGQSCKSAGDAIDMDDDPLGATGRITNATTYLDDYGNDAATFDIGCTEWDTLASPVVCRTWGNAGFATGLPAGKANRILWDFCNAEWKDKIKRGLGFANKNDPNSKVQYVFVEFSVPMKRRAYYTPGEFTEMYDKVMTYSDDLDAPSYFGKPGMTDTMCKWMWMNTQKLYLSSTLTGVMLAILLAFLVLCVATNNIIIASLAVLTIACVVACVIGMMYLAGWELGNIESICLTILAGFCADYIVHLAHSYVECPDTSSRITRVEYSVGHPWASACSLAR
jgi:hypothetical protein